MSTRILQSTLLWAVGLLIIGIPLFLWFVAPPFFSGTVVEIERGATVKEAAAKVADVGAVYTPELLSVPFLLSDGTLAAGTYRFSPGETAVDIYTRLETGDYRIPQAEVVIPEGFTNGQIARRFASELGEENFNTERFLQLAASEEGYLFPDTYRFSEGVGEEELITQMRQNFNTRIEEIIPELEAFGEPLTDVIKMASLVEREAARAEDRRAVAGVLWRRIEAGMPLQVDAVFAPLIGKSTYDLTTDDLATDSPYNLYTNRGLPPTPIANPGLASISATVNPTAGASMYYLTGDDGNFYFADTLEEHQENKRQFLNTNE